MGSIGSMGDMGSMGGMEDMGDMGDQLVKSKITNLKSKIYIIPTIW